MSNPSITADKTPWYQWDTGLTVTVSGGAMTECHFANRKQGTAYVQAVINGVARVPDELLQVAAPIKAYGYVFDGAGGQTYIEQTFEVIARNIPADYTYTKTAQKTIRDAEVARDEAVQAAKDAKTSALDADDSAIEASKSAQSAGDSASAAATSARTAATSAGEAKQSASDANSAKVAAQTAKAEAETAKSEAATSASNAAESAEAAAQSASDAAASVGAINVITPKTVSNGNISHGDLSFALGYGCNTGNYRAAIAIGVNCVNSIDHSVCIGFNSTVTRPYEVSFGNENQGEQCTLSNVNAPRRATDVANKKYTDDNDSNTLSKAKKYTDDNTSNALVGKVSGKLLHVDDAWPSGLLGIEIEGACKQDGTPSPEAPVPIEVIENPVVKVTGRNLLIPSKMANTGTYYQNINGELKVVNGDGRAWTTVPEYGVLPAGTYYIGGDSVDVRHTVDDARIAFTTGATVSFKLDTATPVKIKIGFGHPDAQYPYVSHVMLLASSGNDVTYAPYTSQSLPFTLPAEHPYLAKLPDGTADEIKVDKDGNVTLVARVGKAVLDGSQTFTSFSLDGIDTYYETSQHIGSGMLPTSQWGGLFDRFITANPYTLHSGACAYAYANTNGVSFRIRPSETFADADGFRNWLKSNPVTSYYANTEPKTYQLGKVTVLSLPDSISNVWTDAELTTTMSMTYKQDVNAVIAGLTAQVAALKGTTNEPPEVTDPTIE